MEAANQAAQQGVEAANRSAQLAARGGEQVARESAFATQRVVTRAPIKDYDSSNVDEIVEQPDKLSAEELQAARGYAKQNKDRESLTGQIDRSIEATW